MKRQRTDAAATATATATAPEEPTPAPTVVSPHLASVNRAALDFDFERACSVTLATHNVYACLVCGRFFAGRAASSPLVKHALSAGHFVAMSLADGAVYALPEGRAVADPSLDDIRFNLRPTYAPADVDALVPAPGSTSAPAKARFQLDLQGARYLPGLVGLNSATGFVNATLQCLFRVRRLARFFLLRGNWESSPSRVTRAFGELTCQVWCPKRFKSAASPHEFLQAVDAASGGKFKVGAPADAARFLAWLLDELHYGVGGTRAPGSSVVWRCFQGEVRVDTVVVELKREFAADRPVVSTAGPAAPRPSPQRDDGGGGGALLGTATRASVALTKTEHVPFCFLSLELPTKPVFTGEMDPTASVIPRTTLLELLTKFDGAKEVRETLPGRVETKRFVVTRLPETLVLQLKRFTKGRFFVERNRSIVTLPAQMDMAPCCAPRPASAPYELLANVCHEGDASGAADPVAAGVYKANVRYPSAPDDLWFQAHDQTLRDTMPQLVAVSDTYLALYERVAASQQ